MPNLTLLGSLEVSHYCYPGVGVEINRIKAVLTSVGLAYWTGTKLGKSPLQFLMAIKLLEPIIQMSLSYEVPA